MSEQKFVFCENCKRVFMLNADSHINECPLCDKPNNMPEISVSVADELARRDGRIAELEAMINPASFDKYLVEQLKDPDLAEQYAKAIVRDISYKELYDKTNKLLRAELARWKDAYDEVRVANIQFADDYEKAQAEIAIRDEYIKKWRG